MILILYDALLECFNGSVFLPTTLDSPVVRNGKFASSHKHYSTSMKPLKFQRVMAVAKNKLNRNTSFTLNLTTICGW